MQNKLEKGERIIWNDGKQYGMVRVERDQG